MSLPFSKGKIKVFVSSVCLDKEIKLKQQRVLQCFQARKIEHTVADIAEGTKNKRELRMLMMGKPIPPPVIFNGNDLCGDYQAFCLAVEDEVLEIFLQLKTAEEIKKEKEKAEKNEKEEEKGKEEKKEKVEDKTEEEKNKLEKVNVTDEKETTNKNCSKKDEEKNRNEKCDPSSDIKNKIIENNKEHEKNDKIREGFINKEEVILANSEKIMKDENPQDEMTTSQKSPKSNDKNIETDESKKKVKEKKLQATFSTKTSKKTKNRFSSSSETSNSESMKSTSENNSSSDFSSDNETRKTSSLIPSPLPPPPPPPPALNQKLFKTPDTTDTTIPPPLPFSSDDLLNKKSKLKSTNTKTSQNASAPFIPPPCNTAEASVKGMLKVSTKDLVQGRIALKGKYNRTLPKTKNKNTADNSQTNTETSGNNDVDKNDTECNFKGSTKDQTRRTRGKYAEKDPLPLLNLKHGLKSIKK